jgi:hypothetical protein
MDINSFRDREIEAFKVAIDKYVQQEQEIE